MSSQLHERNSERPRERCLKAGAQALSIRELLALVLGDRRLAARLLESPGTGMDDSEEERSFFLHSGVLQTGDREGPRRIFGLGDAQHARILATFEIARRYSAARTPLAVDPGAIRVRRDLKAEAFSRIPADRKVGDREWLAFVPVYRALGARRRVGGFCLVESGVRTHVNTDATEIFARVLALRPEGIFLFHNHPSGDPTPSSPDYDLTQKVRVLAAQFRIELFGHGIVTAAPTPGWIT